jgi:hypothetical protein
VVAGRCRREAFDPARAGPLAADGQAAAWAAAVRRRRDDRV